MSELGQLQNMGRKQKLRDYLEKLSEQELQHLLRDFFNEKVGDAYLMHGTAEHGIDIAVKVPPGNDCIGTGQYLVVQVKRGNLNSVKWRNDVLGQLLEASYYPTIHPRLDDEGKPRRVLLILTGNLAPEVRQSVTHYNQVHCPKLEVFELDDLTGLLCEKDYCDFLDIGKEIPSSKIDEEVYGRSGR